MDTRSMPRSDMWEIIRAYDSPIVRAYSWGRFQILRQRFLTEIGQYLPPSGKVLDIGCGFGLFSLYFAKRHPNLEILGIDLNPHRIQMARKAAQKLFLPNVRYEIGDVTSIRLQEQFDGAYMLDIAHHIPREAVPPLIEHLFQLLRAPSRLILKDVNTKPAYKRWFTLALDKMMDPHTHVNYWELEELQHVLTESGFEVFCHAMLDYLPYPHMLYVCQKPIRNFSIGHPEEREFQLASQ